MKLVCDECGYNSWKNLTTSKYIDCDQLWVTNPESIKKCNYAIYTTKKELKRIFDSFNHESVMAYIKSKPEIEEKLKNFNN